MAREPAETSDRKKTDSQILYVFNYQRRINVFLMFIEIKASL